MYVFLERQQLLQSSKQDFQMQAWKMCREAKKERKVLKKELGQEMDKLREAPVEAEEEVSMGKAETGRQA